MSKAQVNSYVRAAWNNSFGLDPGASIAAQDGQAGAFAGVGHFGFRSEDLNGRERSTGNITYQVSIQAENGSCLLRVHGLVHKGNTDAKGGPVHLGTLRNEAPAELQVSGMGRSSAVRLYREAGTVSTAHIERLLARFESTLRNKAEP